jgi:hypothetical protein
LAVAIFEVVDKHALESQCLSRLPHVPLGSVGQGSIGLSAVDRQRQGWVGRAGGEESRQRERASARVGRSARHSESLPVMLC